MIDVRFSAPVIGRRTGALRLALALFTIWMVGGTAAIAQVQTGDPAVRYMDGVARELIAASRTRSAATLQSVVVRHADLAYIAGQGLGEYGSQVTAAERPAFLSGLARWMARYAISQVANYQVSHVTFQPASRSARYGLMVDSTIHMRDGSTYDVSWLLARSGGGFKVRDAQLQLLSMWMTGQLNRLFANYIAENGGQAKALVIALNRQ